MKKLLLGLGAMSVTILPMAAMLSCSSTPASLKEFQYNVTQKSSTKRILSNSDKNIVEENVLDPAFNIQAMNEVEDLKKSLTKEKLQSDFNFALTDFYEIYEIETQSLEIELDKIEVLSYTYTAKTSTTPSKGLAKLKVFYELETNNGGNDLEVIKSKEIDWEVKLTTSTPTQIQIIKDALLKPIAGVNNIDISDLKEFFLGEKNADEADDFGIFDRIYQLNQLNSKNLLGGLVGYSIQLKDIFSQLTPTRKVTLDTEFFVPSKELGNTYLVPNIGGSLNYEYDTIFLSTISKATILTYTTQAQLNSILKIKDQTELSAVASILVEDMTTLLKITINFTDTSKLSEVISLNPSLLVQPVQPV